MDTTTDSITDNDSDEKLASAELPVDLNSLSVDGVNPEVGDQVKLKVEGNVTRVVNGTAWVKPIRINEMPLPDTPMVPNPAVDEKTRLMDLSHQADQAGGLGGGY